LKPEHIQLKWLLSISGAREMLTIIHNEAVFI